MDKRKRKPGISDMRFEASVPVAVNGDTEAKTRTFAGVAYSGGVIQNHFYWGNVAFDVSTTEAPEKLPALMNHDGGKIAGFIDQFELSNAINVEGRLSAVTPFGQEVGALSDEGFPWQMSVYIQPGRLEEVQAGSSVELNGQTMQGPLTIFRDNTLREISFTPTGWDSNTSAAAMSRIAEQITNPQRTEEPDMELKDALDRITELEGKFASAEQARDAEKARADTAEAKLSEFSASQRKADVTELFGVLGREVTDEAIKPYLEMDPGAFSVLAKDLKAQASASAENHEHLFERMANDPAGAGSENTAARIDRLAAL